MADVVIDGQHYVPADGACRIGVAITTHGRNDILARNLEHHRQHLPPGAAFVVVDDASPKPVDGADHRFEHTAGIPAAKNKCIELLMARGCEHLFLWDDDAYPIADNWWKPYVESPEPHLMAQFLDMKTGPKLGDITILHQDPQHIAYSGPRGYMLYLHRSAVETVGGMDPIYGRGMYEHGDLSNRIHHAGLTTWRYADVAGSEQLIHSMDQHGEVKRSVPAPERAELVKRNADLHNERMRAGYAAYIEYRQPRDVVLTCLLTSQPDPQRGKRWPADPKTLQAWASSITGADPVVVADELAVPPTGAELHSVPPAAANCYLLRWLHYYRYLRAHPEIRWVWCTDGSDVIMLRPPWGEMEPGTLYVGSEPKTCDDEWMLSHHPAERYQTFLRAHARTPLLNAGLLGGDRVTVLAFCHAMIRETHDLAADRFLHREKPGVETGDMAALNLVAYRDHADHLTTGPGVHTVFRANETNNRWAWWKHR